MQFAVINSLRNNKYQSVAIPENRESFAKFGYLTSPGNQYTGDEKAPVGSTKIEDIVAADRLNQQKIQEEQSKND